VQALVFGASGALGSEICSTLNAKSWSVLRAARSSRQGFEIDLSQSNWTNSIVNSGGVDAVIWAQGINSSGTVISTSQDDLLESLNANVVFIAHTLKALVAASAVNSPCRGVVISSIWQNNGRSEKFAYMVSKSALQGLVTSVSIDLADKGFSINAVLPGVIDTPMTRSRLSSEQIARIELDTPGEKLASADEVANAVEFLADSRSSGIKGQFISVDNGWSVNRNV
jgi:NAD(P)-dependent dehydrogenase (short-subunit alcohol dehydrogenase family)